MMQETFWSTRTRIVTNDEPDTAFVSTTPRDDDESYAPSDETAVTLRFSNFESLRRLIMKDVPKLFEKN